MGERRILVIGSQWQKGRPLSFLPQLAQELYSVLVDPQLGQCVPSLKQGASLVLDPSVAQATQAISDAFQRASADQATLVLAYLGHGEAVGQFGQDFFLLPVDAASPPMNHTAINLVELIRQLHQQYSLVDGLVVLLDACYAGVAAWEAATRWVTALGGTLRFVALTATNDRPAYDGCFTRTLVETIRRGLRGISSDKLECADFLIEVEERCQQRPQLPSYRFGRDPGLWLARNAYWPDTREFWQQAGALEEMTRLLTWYQPPGQLAAIVERARNARCLALVAPPGYGKSTTAAALARPEVTAGAVPNGFIHAVLFLNRTMIPRDFACSLGNQLHLSVPEFKEARRRFESQIPLVEWPKLSTLRQEVLGPLQELPAKQVRIVLDGLDQAQEETRTIIGELIEQVQLDPSLQGVSFIVLSRPDPSFPKGSQTIDMDAATDVQLLQYFEQRRLPDPFREEAVQRAGRNWLVARLLADLYSQHPEGFTPQSLPTGLGEIYEEALTRAGAGDPTRWRNQLRPVLTVMAAAGVGPILPLPLLVAASKTLDGPSSAVRIRDVLVDLRVFLIRQDPGSAEERVGLFHQTFIDFLSDPRCQFSIETSEGHHALLEAITQLAPASAFDPKHLTSLQRYAAYHEAEHLWGAGQFTEIVASLDARAFVAPAENLARWRPWSGRLEKRLGGDHHDTLWARHRIAELTDKAGDSREALRLFRELLPDLERVLGKDHSETLAIRHHIAYCTGKAGDAAGALRLLKELLPDQERDLGKDHPDTLRTRVDIAGETDDAGDPREALRLFTELLPDLERVLGRDDDQTLTTRNRIAILTGYAGDPRGALRLLRELLPDLVRVHRGALSIRHNIAYWTDVAGDPAGGLRLLKELLPDQERDLGKDHPGTLVTRSNIARLTGEVEGAEEAIRLFRELLPDYERVLGRDHPKTLLARKNMAFWIGYKDDTAGALRLLKELFPDQERVLGKDHPDTLTTRANIAYWSCKDSEVDGLRLFRELLPDLERVLGRDYPLTKNVRDKIDRLTNSLRF